MKRAYWAGILLLYVVFLVATAPASILFWAANKHFSPDYTFTAESSSGTLWDGEARGIVLSTKDKKTLHLEQASWSLDLLWLLSGKLSADLMLAGDGIKGNGNVILGMHSIRLRQVNFSIPAALLPYMAPRLGMWPLQGMVNIRSKEFLLQPDHYRGEGEVTWAQAGISLSKVNPIGSYQITFSGIGKAIQFQLQTKTGPLELIGKGNWSQPASFEFNGSAKTREHESELRNLLGLIGKPNQDHSYTIKF
jgi:hypothetical protein